MHRMLDLSSFGVTKAFKSQNRRQKLRLSQAIWLQNKLLDQYLMLNAYKRNLLPRIYYKQMTLSNTHPLATLFQHKNIPTPTQQIIELTETPPTPKFYIKWMGWNIKQIRGRHGQTDAAPGRVKGMKTTRWKGFISFKPIGAKLIIRKRKRVDLVRGVVKTRRIMITPLLISYP